jgi:hypothetical protein
LYADTNGRTDRHAGINGRFAQLFMNAPKSKYVVKLHFKDSEVPAYGRKAWSYNNVSFAPNTTRTLNDVQHNVDILMAQPLLQKFHNEKVI